MQSAKKNMFKRLDDTPEKLVTVTIEGQPVEVPAGETVAAVVLASGLGHTRTTPVSGAPRAPYCLMGVCYECLMVINGQPNRRACREVVDEGMTIERQYGPGELST
jgi:predicted molibdopterin-dependent oxidoreductase YjgC